jgi:hypothetical protein
MNAETARVACEKESSVPAEDLLDLGSVSESTKGYTLGHYYDGDRGLFG